MTTRSNWKNASAVSTWCHAIRAQLRRFKKRERTGFKSFKITADDWRNREKWPMYEVAANDMIERTSTEFAPWTLAEANDKYHAWIKVLKALCERLEDELGK